MNNSQLLDTHFVDYLKKRKEINLHPKMDNILNKIPEIPNCNIIIYGPPGIGKYSFALSILEKQSIKKLNYERKMLVQFNKEEYYFKISDIHFEIDMELLGCNAKLFWNEIFLQIEDVISSRQNGFGIILCKNFHKIHNELLENFYSYMQMKKYQVKIYFYIISESISFLSNSILSSCLKINISRPTITQYNKAISSKINSNNINFIENLKEVKISNNFNYKYVKYCNILISKINKLDSINFIQIREIIYDMLIYNYDTFEVIYILLDLLFEKKIINEKKLSLILIDVHNFYKTYNNNYRPIYHLEILIFKIISIINEL